MADPYKKILEPIKDLQTIRGVQLPIGLEFLQLVVTGPPGAGKSYYIEQIKGWPNEGYLDLAQKNWWKDQSLIYRPREVHLGLPFKGVKESITVFEKEWLKSRTPLEIEFRRIMLPPVKKSSFQTNWRKRYIFEFLIPRPSVIFDQRQARQKDGYFPVDENLTIEMVRKQVAVYREVALYLHRAGLNVYIRKGLDKPPLFFAEPGVASVPRWTLDKRPRKPRLNTLDGWKYLLKRRHPIQWITVTNTPQKIKQEGRIAHDGRSFGLYLGSNQLCFHPEIALGVKKKAAHKHWIINTELTCSATKIRGFLRLKVGETIVLGQSNPDFMELFEFNKSVGQRHISITNRRGDLILTPLAPEFDTRVVLLDNLDLRERMERGRYEVLLKIRKIYGQEIAPLPPSEALDTLRAVNNLLKNEAHRPKNDKNIAGGLVELPPQTIPIIVGDLHAQVDNLLKILSEKCVLDCLRSNTATLIIMGDAIHSEKVQEMDQFETSMLIMDLIFRFKLRFPDNFFYIRGNHDSFSPEINKNGFLQGELFQEALRSIRGDEYVLEMQRFYDNLAYVITSKEYLCCHAGPPRKKVKRKDIINILPNDKLAKDLTGNRLKNSNRLHGYSKADVKRFRKDVKLPPKATFLVGHTPMDPFGSYWLNAGSIKNHHIIYSGHDDGPSIFIHTGNTFMPISFPSEPLTELINDLK